jgi:hypothetical protein
VAKVKENAVDAGAAAKRSSQPIHGLARLKKPFKTRYHLEKKNSMTQAK